MVTLTDIKEVLGIDTGDNSQDHYLQNLIRRASFRISSACNRQLEYSELIEYFNGNNSDKLYLKNWPVWEIVQLQEFNPETGDYEELINRAGDTVKNSVYIYEGSNGGLIRLLKNYTFGNSLLYLDSSETDHCIRIKYKAGYKNIKGAGTICGSAGTSEISGDETLFETELRIGDRLVTGNFEYTVGEILSDIVLNLSCNLDRTILKESYRVCNVPADLAEAVLMLAAGSYLLKKYEAYGMDQKTESVSAALYNKIKGVADSSSLSPNVKMRFKEFDLGLVIEVYRKINV
ncbi:MAG: phage head-tail connector protein [Ignavibacteria bacterium]|nr:phage head-tail connector protein [Ignavibacteria bacterium]